MSDGIVYLSFGLNYVDCTLAAIRSKIKNSPRTKACILTNRKADLNSKLCRDNGIELKYFDMPDIEVRALKTQLYKHSPFERTLLLDADCWINVELADYFKMLDYAPMVLTHAHHHPSIGTAAHVGTADRNYTLQQLQGLHYLPQYASGLIFFERDNKQVQDTFDIWYTEWARFHNKDQMALMRALLTTKLMPLVLADKHWLSQSEGKGLVSHSFGMALPSMPRKDVRSPRKYTCLP